MPPAPGTHGAGPFRPALVVLDFDGTLTDTDAHAPVFHAASARELGRRLGWDEATLGREWPRALAAVASLPPEAAWMSNGFGVCPAAADPYIIANSATRLLLSRHGAGLTEEAVVRAVLEIHREAYERVLPPFRPGAGGLIDALGADGYRVAVVTNSHTRTVERLLDTLPLRDRAALMVRGDAAKFTVCGPAGPDAGFDALPEAVTWPGLARPVHLRRGRYFDALRAIWRDTATGPGSTLVVGDNFELDLGLPAALGAHVHLVRRAGTPPHELRLADTMPRSGSSADLAGVLDRLRPSRSR